MLKPFVEKIQGFSFKEKIQKVIVEEQETTALYERAVLLSPLHVRALYNFGLFQEGVQHDQDKAELLYRTVLSKFGCVIYQRGLFPQKPFHFVNFVVYRCSSKLESQGRLVCIFVYAYRIVRVYSLSNSFFLATSAAFLCFSGRAFPYNCLHFESFIVRERRIDASIRYVSKRTFVVYCQKRSSIGFLSRTLTFPFRKDRNCIFQLRYCFHCENIKFALHQLLQK